jgi:hypothetical protein
VEPRALPPLVHRKRRPPATARTRLANGRDERSTAVTTRSTAPSTSSAPSAPLPSGTPIRLRRRLGSLPAVGIGPLHIRRQGSAFGLRACRSCVAYRTAVSGCRWATVTANRSPIPGRRVSPPHGVPQPLPGGTGGNPGRCRGELNG